MTSSATILPVTPTVSVTFGEGSMGIRIRGEGSTVSVKSVVPGGVADVAGVQVGDTLAHVNGQAVANFDATMQAIKDAPRPVEIAFCKAGQAQPVVMAQPVGAIGMAPPLGAPPGGMWVQDSYCGPVTFLIGFFVFCFVCCCPCDKRLVYQAPSGEKYNKDGVQL